MKHNENQGADQVSEHPCAVQGQWTVEEGAGGCYLCWGGRRLLRSLHGNERLQFQEIAYLANASLKDDKDTARLDWLDKEMPLAQENVLDGTVTLYAAHPSGKGAISGEGKTFREAIDKAIGQSIPQASEVVEEEKP